MFNYLKPMSLLLFLMYLTACTPRELSEDERWLQQHTINNLVFIQGGTFTMGDIGYTDAHGKHQSFTYDDDNTVLREVTLSPYSVQKYEVTYKETDVWTKVKGKEPLNSDGRYTPHGKPEFPAKGMSWYEAKAYCEWLGELIGYPMSLLTEAQWEYAATSGGRAVKYATDDGSYQPGINTKDGGKNQFQMPPGSWPPNPWGLYDMTGNVGEWVLDWYLGLYLRDQTIDPQGPPVDYFKNNLLKEKVTRGGGALTGINYSQVHKRFDTKPDTRGAGNGIRCAVNHPEPISAPRKNP